MSEVNNSEILFVYDAKMCNPNGDMDDENKPRMDKLNKRNLVSDVRLKRYVRDYLKDFKNQEIWLTQTEKAQDAKDRLKELGSVDNAKELIDVKLFGAVFTDKEAATVTGPVQFNWGYSLNRVDLLKSNTITSHFKTSGSKKSTGGSGIGKDYRVKYSLLAFAGSINSKNAQKSSLGKEDIELFDEAMVKSIPLNRTRSKVGQSPRVYLRIELQQDSFLNDLRDFLRLENEEIQGVEEVSVEVDELIEYLKDNEHIIEKVRLWTDEKLRFTKSGEECSLKEALSQIVEVEEFEFS